MMKFLKQLLFWNTSEKQIVFKNTFWLTISEVLVRLLRFGLILYAARILGTEGWGLFSYTLSFVGLIMTFSDLGLSTLITREFSTQKTSWLRTILILKIGLMMISILGTLIIGITTQSPAVISILLLVILIIGSDSLRGIGNAIIRAQEKMEREAFVLGIANISIVALSLFFLSLQPNTYSLALGYAVGSIIGTIVAFGFTWKDIATILKSRHPFTPIPVLVTVWPMAVLIISLGLIANIDSVMIGWWLPLSEVGYYATAQRIIQFALIIPSIFIGALFPTLNKIYQENKSHFIAITQKSFTILIIIVIPLIIGGILIAEPLIAFLFGTSYLPAVPVFQILLFGCFGPFLLALYNVLAIITDQQSIIAKNTLGAIVVSVLLNLLLIPLLGIIGAAIGTIVTQFFILIANIILIRIPFTIHIKTVFMALLGSLGMTGIIILLKTLSFHPLGIIISASIFYGLFLLIIREPITLSFVELFRNKKTP